MKSEYCIGFYSLTGHMISNCVVALRENLHCAMRISDFELNYLPLSTMKL